MKIRTRITTAVTVALASIFLAAPAFASEEVEKYDPSDAFSAAGEPVQVVPILIVGLVLLAIVLLLSSLIGRLFDQAK
ncbi:hypothetical protein [Leucobacter sp. GX24907]